MCNQVLVEAQGHYLHLSRGLRCLETRQFARASSGVLQTARPPVTELWKQDTSLAPAPGVPMRPKALKAPRLSACRVGTAR